MDLYLFAIFMLACCGAGATGALFPPGEWYKTLEKPWFTPPDWVFPVAWTSIYLLISFAGARLGMMEGSGYALAFWAAQGALATLWTPMFFGLRRLKGSLFVMAGLWLSVAGCLLCAFALDTLAGLAFVPYLIWVTVAAALNVAMWRLNPSVSPLSVDEI